MRHTLIFLSVLLFSTLALAIDAIDDTMATVTNMEFMALLAASIGGLKGLSSIATFHAIWQVLLAFLKSEFGFNSAKKLNPKGKYLVYFLVALIGGVLTLMIQSDLSLVAALMHSAVWTFAGSGAYSYYELFHEKK